MNFLIRKHCSEAICLLLLLVTGISLLMGAAALPAPMFDSLGPAGFPRYAGWLLLALLAVRFVSLVREAKSDAGTEKNHDLVAAGEDDIPQDDNTDAPQILKLLLVSAITLTYLTALTIGGISFTWLTLVFLAALGTAMSDITPRKLVTVAAIAIVMSFALTYAFTDMLSVVLPE